MTNSAFRNPEVHTAIHGILSSVDRVTRPNGDTITCKIRIRSNRKRTFEATDGTLHFDVWNFERTLKRPNGLALSEVVLVVHDDFSAFAKVSIQIAH
jgi:hypothetical protein